jgi:hypothetical protein
LLGEKADDPKKQLNNRENEIQSNMGTGVDRPLEDD